MKKILFDELNKVTSTKLDFTLSTNELHIPKTVKILNSALKKGSVYTIELAKFITMPSVSSTLASNWNSGIVPKHNKYIVEIVDNMANMIKVNGVAVEDNTDQFYGWLPSNGFDVINKI